MREGRCHIVPPLELYLSSSLIAGDRVSRLMVKKRRTQSEHNESAYAPTADIKADIDLRRFGPILLKKSVDGVYQIFSASWERFPNKDAEGRMAER